MSSKKLYTGLTRDNPINIVWSGCPNNSYFIIRNRSYDNTISVKQNTVIINKDANTETTKEIVTPISKMEEQSFYVEKASEGLTLQTELDYNTENSTVPKYCRGATIIVSESDQKIAGKPVWAVDILSAVDYKVTTTVTEKGGIHFTGLADKALSIQDVHNTEYPTKKTNTKPVILAPSTYRSYLGAGRGYLVRNFKGADTSIESGKATTNIFKQVETIDWQIGNTNSNKKDIAITQENAEVPYIPAFVKSQIQEYNDAKAASNDPINFEADNLMSDAFLIVEPSQCNVTEMPYKNIKNKSGIKKIGTLKNPSDSSAFTLKIAGWEGDDTSLVDSKMYKVTEASEAKFNQDRFPLDKIKGFAVTLKTVSRSYPYTIAFSAPLVTGITFTSDTQIVVNILDRSTVFNNIEHLNKVNRYVVSYDENYLSLYINGEKKEHETQSSISTRNKEINNIGLDIKKGYTNSESEIDLRTKCLGSDNKLDIRITAKEINEDNGLVILNKKDIDIYPKNLTADPTPIILPQGADNLAKNQGLLTFGGIEKEKAAILENWFWDMEIVGMTESSGTYTKEITLDNATQNQFTISCIGTDPSFLPEIEITTENSLVDKTTISVSKSRTEQVQLYQSGSALSNASGTKTTYTGTVNNEKFVLLPSTNRKLSVNFKNPKTKAVRVKVNVTFADAAQS